MEKTNIEWCDSTINGNSGCDGCELWNESNRSCYAGNVHEKRWAKSLAVTHPHLYASSFDVVKMIPGRYAKAAAWSDLRGKDRPDKPWLNGKPRHIFVGDMGDFLSRDVTDEFLITELFGAISSPNGQRHVWQLLTKRPNRLARLSKMISGGLPPNCIAMTTATDQKTANLRVRQLLEVNCHWRGISCEPLLGPVNLYQATRTTVSTAKLPIDWVITGGESGQTPRPAHPSWFRSLRDQCATGGVAYFFKQWGEWTQRCLLKFPEGELFGGSEDFSKLDPGCEKWPYVLRMCSCGGDTRTDAGPLPVCRCNESEDLYVQKVGKKLAGRTLDGVIHNAFPQITL